MEPELEEPSPVEAPEPVTEAEAIEGYVESPEREAEVVAPVEEAAPSEEEVVAEAAPIPKLRFAEDIFPTKIVQPTKKGKKAKVKNKVEKQETAKPKKARHTQLSNGEIEEYEELLD